MLEKNDREPEVVLDSFDRVVEAVKRELEKTCESNKNLAIEYLLERISKQHKQKAQLLSKRIATFGYGQTLDYHTNLGVNAIWDLFVKLVCVDDEVLHCVSDTFTDAEECKKYQDLFKCTNVDTTLWEAVSSYNSDQQP